MHKMTRRELLRWAAGSMALAALSRCVPNELQPLAPPATPFPGVTPTPRPPVPPPTIPPSPTPRSTRTAQLLGNENRPGFYIRYYKLFEPVDPNAWTLTINGLVQNPIVLRFSDLETFPLVKQRSRMKCVEGWSVAAQWEGFKPADLVELVQPFPEATWVHFYSADDYYESLDLRELVMERVLLVYRINDTLLPPEYGAPLRLIVPFKYGYKGPKAITTMTFADHSLRGYWPTVGPYSEEGDVQVGSDYALDLDDVRQHGRGEVVYEDGLESTAIP